MKTPALLGFRGLSSKTIKYLPVLICWSLATFSCVVAPKHTDSPQYQDQRPVMHTSYLDDLKVIIDELVSNAIVTGDGSLVAVKIGSVNNTLAVYAGTLGNPRGTALFIHGYMASVGSSKPVIQKLIEDGWLVVALDLPGHGSSGGARHDIGNFLEYGAALRLVVDSLAEAPEPLVLVGHSLGAAAILASLEGMKANPEALVLIAPLLRIRGHGWASFGAALIRPFTKTLPGGTPKRWFYAYKDWARVDQSLALNAALGRGTRVGFVLCGGDEAVSNAAASKLAERTPGTTLLLLDQMSHWEIDKKEPDPRLWEAVLAILDDGFKEIR